MKQQKFQQSNTRTKLYFNDSSFHSSNRNEDLEDMSNKTLRIKINYSNNFKTDAIVHNINTVNPKKEHH